MTVGAAQAASATAGPRGEVVFHMSVWSRLIPTRHNSLICDALEHTSKTVRVARGDTVHTSNGGLAQRENLLEVQGALQELARFTCRAHHRDLVAHRNGAPWGRSLLGEEVSEGLGLGHRRLAALVERIADDSLRSEVKDVHSKLTWQTMAASEEEDESRMRDLDEAFAQGMPHLGAVLRDY
jgi:hypothetical protein